MTVLRCVSWAAVSSERQAEEISLDVQKETNRENAAVIGGAIVETLEVPGHSREYDTIAEIAQDVPAYADLLQMLNSRAFDVLLAYRPDRLARTPALLMEIAQKCWRNGVALYIDSMPPQSLDPRRQQESMSQVLLLAFSGVQAGDEINVLRARHRFGMPNRINKGMMPARPPYGYKYEIINERTKRVVIDDAVAHTVRYLLVDLLAERQLPYLGIAEILNREGHIAPTTRQAQLLGKEPQYSGRWAYAGVRSIAVRASCYAGYIEYNKVSSTGRKYMIVRGGHEPIITEDELVRVESAMEGKQRGAPRTYPLSGVVICGICGRSMIGHTSRHRDGTICRYYMYCRPCGFLQQEDRIFAKINEAVIVVEQGTDISHLSRDQSQQETEDLLQRIRQIDEMLVQRNAAIRNLVSALEDATLPLDIISEQLRTRKAQVNELEQERGALEKEVVAIQSQPTIDDAIAEIQRAGSQMMEIAKEKPGAWRRWAQRVFDTVIVHPDGKVEIYL